ncbi:four helix bundle protein [Lederbergia lenta]|uniref:Four helix bundle protein n=1 Tax=Lederbergia lenta TaxID=1467 RepID=A0A2X4WZ54_LEDLE|nr:four helix bundle protein [Lederbergia lenta]
MKNIQGVMQLTAKYLTLQNVEKLRALQLSIELLKEIGMIVEVLPFEESQMKDQLQRSATSIVQNIAKGEQLYLRQKFNLYSDAIGSAQETKSWLMTCNGKGLISEGEFLTLDSMIDSIIKMLNRILENLKINNSSVSLPIPVVQNVRTLPCVQTAQRLVKELYELQCISHGEWYSYILKQMVTSASNIASHASESEQLYPKKKLAFLNLAIQESNVVKAYLNLMMSKGIYDREKYEEIKEMIEEIQYLLIQGMKQIDTEIKVLM